MAQLRKDLKVNTYEGELTTYYECRLIYSALAEWMRFTVFDEVTDDYFCKSKAYILRRGIEVLRSFIGSSPALQQWFLEDEKGVHEFDAPVKEIRDNDYDLTINKYKEVEKEVKVYRPTADILADIEETQNEMIEAFAELKKLLGD